MKNSYLILFGLLTSTSLLANNLPLAAPRKLTATWEEGAGTMRTINLNWVDESADETSFFVQRKIDTGAWATLPLATTLPAGSTSFSDATVARGTAAATRYIYYRVIAKRGTVDSGAAEVATVGIPFTWPTAGYDKDADGIIESQEGANGGTDDDWLNALRDGDGNMIPNAWQANGVVGASVTVDSTRTATDTSVETKTINAAISKFSGTSNDSYRVILVKPGIYNETINYTGNYKIAFIADKTGVNRYKECEIRGLGSSPVITTVGSCVFNGFVISRAAGSKGAAFSFSEPASPVNRISVSGLVNCIFRGMDTGTSPIIQQNRGRLLVDHCTFYNNAVDSVALAHTYSSGLITVSSTVSNLLASTAKVVFTNSILWNPIRVNIPEWQSDGAIDFLGSIVYGGGIVVGTQHVNPNLTPTGYLLNNHSAAATGGQAILGAGYDIHGDSHSRVVTLVTGETLCGRGADAWSDLDADGIPDFADREPNNPINAAEDLDFDLLSDLEEYQDGTDIYSSDSSYLTMEQARREFMPTSSANYLTRTEGDSRYIQRDQALQKVRVLPGGNIPMGSFTGGGTTTP